MTKLIEKDTPINNIHEDNFNRKEFVNNILRVINYHTSNNKESIAFGITGEWGVGKTSIVNLLNKNLKDNGYSTIIFNSQFYKSINADLTYSFFSSLIKCLKGEKTNFFQRIFNKNKTVKIAKEISKLILSVAPIPNIYAETSKTIINELLEQPKEDNLDNLKQRINFLFDKYAKKPIIIFFDDLDRLNKNELIEVMQLVKMNADFDKIIYILSYDKNVVCKTLYGQQKTSGKDYLKKIVQNEFNCPFLTLGQLESYASKIFKEFITKLNSKGIDCKQEFRDLENYYKLLIKTPRDFIRIYNCFIADFLCIHKIDSLDKLVSLEIEIKDLLLLVILKIYYPETYKFIYLNKQSIIKFKDKDDLLGPRAEESEVNKIEKMLESKENDPVIELIFNELLPEKYSPEYQIKKRPLSNEMYFDVYFSMDYEDAPLTQEEYELFFDSLEDLEKLKEQFQKFLDNKKERLILKELYNSTKNRKISGDKKLSNILQVLRINSDKLNSNTGFLTLSDFDYSVEIAVNILTNNYEERYHLFLKVLIEGDTNWVLSYHTINAISWRIKRKKLEEYFIDTFPIANLKKELVKNSIKNLDSIFEYEELHKINILSHISSWGTKTNRNKIIIKLKNEQEFMKLLKSAEHYTTEYSQGKSVTSLTGIRTDLLEKIYGISEIEKRLKLINSSESKRFLELIEKSKKDPRFKELGSDKDE